MELIISIIGASVAILVSLIGAWLANRNSIALQIRKLKEQYYIDFVTSLHNSCAYNNSVVTVKYVEARDVLFSVASTNVVSKIIDLEECGADMSCDIFNRCLTDLIKAIRKDLKLSNKKLPQLFFKRP